jgi:glucan 1,4-alpha-glucosidase
MRLRTAINEYKRARGEQFAGEARTVTGALSGSGGRLVHVDPAGHLRDYSSALSGLYGIDRSRFGIETAERTYWFDDLDTIRQHYYNQTSLVETEYDAGRFTVHQYDLTLGRAHVTHVELRGEIPAGARFVAFLTMAPEGQETRVGQLVHEDAGPDGSPAVEVYHRREHDYVTASTGLGDVRGQIPERFAELLDDDPIDFPRGTTPAAHEDTHLSGDVVVTAPLERVGRGVRTTLATRISDHDEVDRERALADLKRCVTAHDSADSLRAAAGERTAVAVDDAVPRSDLVRADQRVFDLLAAESGARIAAPEFDPFFASSGGYGYTWFREDVQISTALLSTADRFGLDIESTLRRSARFYCRTQLDDGTWPHRVWAVDGSLAPGWANATVEGDDDGTYQADQTASVTAFLARLLCEHGDDFPRDLAGTVEETVTRAFDTLAASLAGNGLPEPCQNAWEGETGQFTHTAATYVEAFAAVARAPVEQTLRKRARTAVEEAVSGLDALWDETGETYAMRLVDGDPDLRLDASTFALVRAFEAYASLPNNELSEDDLDRLTEHVSTTLDGLFRNPRASPVAGLARFEGDRWRRGDQEGAKVWSVATAWGAAATARLGVLANGYGRNGDAYLRRAADLYELLDEDGPLVTDVGYLAEQTFDDGTPDSGAPLGRAHAFRLSATATLAGADALPTAAAGPEGPTERPRWTTGEKYGVGTVPDHGETDPSRVWFTLTEGALTELRFPRVDLMNLRTLDFLVRARDGTGATVRTHNETRRDDATDTVERRVEPVVDDALLYRQVVAQPGDGQGHEWTLTVEYAAAAGHDAVVADVRFEAHDGGEYDVFAVADTALTNTGTRDRGLRLDSAPEGGYHLAARDATAFTGETGEPLLVDDDGEGYSVALAMAAAGRFDWATVGVAGSPYLRELFAEGTLPDPQERVDDENVVLVGRLGTGPAVEETLALGCARSADTAAALGEAAGSLARGYETVRSAYVEAWQGFLSGKPLPDSVAGDDALANQYRTALMTLLAVEDKTYLGASIASPSVPWGEAVAAEAPRGYGYNFVWSRDLYQVFTAFETVDDLRRAVDQLTYVYRYQQDEQGFIPQNTYLNGLTRWGGEQMDNISFPQVMAYQLFERGYSFEEVDYDYEHVRRSANYVARNGPATAQERWEEEAGYSPSTIAAEIAGLACAGKLAVETGHEADALIWLALADQWTNRVEDWTATETGTDRHATTPYYVRATRDGDPDAGHLRTLANDGPTLDEREIVDAGFLELVRLGIKPADDPVIRNSVAEVDSTIRVDVDPTAAFYRYNGDGYGERERDDKGAPWSAENAGKGRLWPLLTGERAEYELLAGDATGDGAIDPAAALRTLGSFANSGRMLPEQVWDREDATEYNWVFGKGTGSATPLAWAMAQYVRLAHGIDAGEPVETPQFVRERYVEREVNRQDRSPALRVDTRFEGDRIVVSGETTGEVVAAKTTADVGLVRVEEGTFELRLRGEYGENQVTVAAATGRDLERAGTTVTRITL